jgi:hypothetical protein
LALFCLTAYLFGPNICDKGYVTLFVRYILVIFYRMGVDLSDRRYVAIANLEDRFVSTLLCGNYVAR